MKKHLISISIFIFAVVFAPAQGLAEMQGIEYRDSNTGTLASPSVSQMDTAVKTLADGLNKKLGEVKADWQIYPANRTLFFPEDLRARTLQFQVKLLIPILPRSGFMSG